MMKVTRTTQSMIINNKHKANKKSVMIQRMNANGKWGKAFEAEMIGCETTAEQVVARYIKNNNREFRIAE